MSQLLIQQYPNQLQRLKKVAGTTRESAVREAFKDLLKGWGRSLDLTFVPEAEYETKTKDRRYIDGALMHAWRAPFGYWEAKDEKDDLDAEIEHKLRRGYSRTNIIFKDPTARRIAAIRVVTCACRFVMRSRSSSSLFDPSGPSPDANTIVRRSQRQSS